MLSFIALQTDRLILRRLTIKDSDFIFQHYHNPRVTQYFLNEPLVANYEQAQAIIKSYLEPEGKTYNRWGIF